MATAEDVLDAYITRLDSHERKNCVTRREHQFVTLYISELKKNMAEALGLNKKATANG